MEQEDLQKTYLDRTKNIEDVIHFIQIPGDKGEYNILISPMDCTIDIRIPYRFSISDDLLTFQERSVLYQEFDKLLYENLRLLLSKKLYKRIIHRGQLKSLLSNKVKGAE